MPTRRIAVVNEKGGCAKTTTALNLAAGLAMRHQRTLLIDYDPQANASQALGLARAVEDGGLYDAARFTFEPDVPFAPVRDLPTPGVDLIPGTVALAYSEWTGSDPASTTRLLADAVDRVASSYDFVLVDCGPTIGISALRAMVAAPEILIPVKLEVLSVPGAIRLRRHLENLRDHQADLRIMGVLGTFDRDTAKSPKEILATLRDAFGATVFTTTIHQSQAVADAAATGRPIILLDAASRGAKEYSAVLDEVIARA